MSTISFSNVNTNEDGVTTVSGIASDIDSASLIDDLVAVQQQSIDANKDEITVNNNKKTSVSELSTLLERFRSTSDFLRAQPGVNNETNNFFKYTSTSLSSNTTVDAGTYLSVTSVPGATPTSYSVEDITLAKSQIIRKDNFTSDSASVVGNAAVTDDYSVALPSSFTGSVLNTTTPITFANDINANGVATAASLDVIFGNQNQFDATDTLTVGDTVITFGGTGGNDIDISSATTLNDKIDAIVTRLNNITTGTEANTNYTYSRSADGVLTITRNIAGAIATVGSDLTVSANFSTGTTDTTQTVGFGSLSKNNGSSSGSVAPVNGAVSGSVSSNGIPGIDASTQATVNVVFSADNEFDVGDTITIGDTVISFNSGGGDTGTAVDTTINTTVAQVINRISDILNAQTTGPELGYSFETSGSDTLVITRDEFGSNSSVVTNLALSADLSTSGTNQTIQFGSGTAANVPTATTLDQAGTDGVDTVSITDAKSTATSTLSGAVSVTGATYIAGSQNGSTFTSNSVTFTATIGGQTYTSRAIELDGGNVDGTGSGTSGLGNNIASGTVITFVKDSSSDTTAGTEDVTVQLVVGDAITIADDTEADAFATSIDNFLNTDNSISITNNSLPFRAGTFTLGGVDITLEEGDNLQVIRSKINSVSESTGVIADVIKVDDGDFSLTLKATDTGVDNRILEYAGTTSDAGDPPANTIQLGLDNIAFSSIQAESDASLTIDGLTITRSSNVIADAIDDLTFTLNTDSPGGTTLTAVVAEDTTTVENGVIDFLNAYNEIKFFVASQQEVDAEGNFVEDAILGGENILRDVVVDIERELSRTISGLSSGALDTLFSVGIETADFPGDADTPAVSDIFVIDLATFRSNIAANFEEVRDVFAFNFAANSTDISVFSRTNDVSLNDFKLVIDDTQPEGSRVQVLDLNDNFLFNATLQLSQNQFGNPVTGQGGTIVGQAGTALEGLELIYTGDGSDTITVSLTQGIADRVFNLLDDDYLDPSTGIIQTLLDSFDDDNERIQDIIDREEVRISNEKERLTAQFSQAEAIIASANNTISLLQSTLESRFGGG